MIGTFFPVTTLYKPLQTRKCCGKIVSQDKGQYFGNNVSLFPVALTYLSSGVLLEEEKVPWRFQCF